ncbi:hypothetical protein CDV36_014761 [Fusarium kuroshium]|uniref:Uncharacterized protein n=1 Tax=Fusarium kuroshium TaxID=2010991 RepID=A0A3M2REH4_9HYPO|nr:hypothetical protein CDV36_014761 [Fusarium kuroshium]
MIDGNMASTEAATATLSVHEIAAMSDAELGQFMTEHRCPDGGYELPVDGWDKLSKDERDRLAERLKAQERGLTQSPTAYFRPLDLDDLDARLRRVSPNKSFSLRPETRTTRSPTPPFDPTIRETEAYYELINAGGRPLYPIDLVQDIFRDPGNYAELLWPWQVNISPVSPSGIFQKQLQRWQDFRKWQNDNRDREDDDGDFLAYIEQEKRRIKIHCLPRSRDKQLAEIEADPSCLKSSWEDRQWERERQRRHCRERGCRGFHDYTEAVKRRLVRHGLTQPFELDEDPKNQDKLTTWIEYLNYEYWWLDKYTSDIERLEPEHDKLWQELVDKKILRPHETKEFVRTAASGMECEAEKDQAMKTVQRAESEAKRIYVSTQEDPKRLRIPKAKRISMLKHGTEKLLAAKRRLEQVQSRSFLIVQFVRATFDYDEAKRDAARHCVLVQWVLDQVPLIEAEMNPCKANKRLGSGGRRATKRRLTADEEPPERQNPKRVRIDLEEPSLASARIPKRLEVHSPEIEPAAVRNRMTFRQCHKDPVAAHVLRRVEMLPGQALSLVSLNQEHAQGLEQHQHNRQGLIRQLRTRKLIRQRDGREARANAVQLNSAAGRRGVGSEGVTDEGSLV